MIVWAVLDNPNLSLEDADQVIGVFETEQLAVDSCFVHTSYVIRLEMNKVVLKGQPIPGYYPFYNYHTSVWEDSAKIRDGYEAFNGQL